MAKIGFLALDYGAESGRAMAGFISDGGIELAEVHRFPNRPVETGGSLCWDLPALFNEAKQGIGEYLCRYGGVPDSMAVDTWGVDFGFIDEDGKLLGQPVHYRDGRTAGVMERAFETVPAREIYEQTGIQHMAINTLYQLIAVKEGSSPVMERAESLLMMGDLFNYLLTGNRTCEYTLATTTQLFSPRERTWSDKLIRAFDLPREIFGEIRYPGEITGTINEETCRELGCGPFPVIAAASHDTASAAAAVPAGKKSGRAFLSCGTWSILGVAREKPLISDDTFRYNFSNEGGAGGSINFQKNISGLWPLQECRRKWDIGYEEIVRLAESSAPFTAFIDIDDRRFLNPADMEREIREYCARTVQKAPQTRGAAARVILESLAVKYRLSLEQLESCTGVPVESVQLIGGGSRNSLLCQMTADAVKRPVLAGPVESTALGNILVQAGALGVISSPEEGRELIGRSFPVKVYEPRDTGRWDEFIDKKARLTMPDGSLTV